MGLVCIIDYIVQCLSLLALVYPLCASIRAIETDSSSDFRKLVAYWVLFSLTFLFEDAFVKILEWLPFLWPYIKLIIFTWLVFSNFDGAFYLYEHLLRPFLSISFNAKHFINQFKEKKELFLNRINVVPEKKRDLKENTHEAFEEIVATKSHCKEPSNISQKYMKTVEVTDKKEVAAGKQQVGPAKPCVAQTDNKKFEPEGIKGIPSTVVANNEFSEIPISKQVQQEWTCGICQFTAQSEAILKLHLQGIRHKYCEEQLKTKKQPSESEVLAASEDKKSLDSELPKRLQVQQDNLQNKCVELKDSLWYCTICNVSCHSMDIMFSHLNGKKHLTRIRQSNVDGDTSSGVVVS